MATDIKLPAPALYVGTKLFPYEQRMFATASLRESLGYTSSPVEYYTADQVRQHGDACYAKARADLIAELRPVAWRYLTSDVWDHHVLTEDRERADLASSYGMQVEALAIIPKE